MTNHTSIHATLRTLLTTLAVGCLAACSDGGDEPLPSENTGSTLSVSFTVSGSEGKATRALASDVYEAGNDALNENYIQRLDILVYDEDGKRLLHNYWDGSESDNATLTTATSTEADKDATGLSNAQYTLTADNVPNMQYAGKRIYVVANWTGYDDASAATLAGLQAANMTPPSMADPKANNYVAGFVPYTKQQFFLMDGSCTPEAADVTYTENTDTNGNKTGNTTTTVIKTIELRRAIAKIRLHILNESGQELYAPHLFYRLMNYSGTVNIVADNSLEASKTVALANYPLDNAEEKTYNSAIPGADSKKELTTPITIKTNYGRIREETVTEENTESNGTATTTYKSTPGAYNIVVEGENEDETTGVVATNDKRHDNTTYTGYVFYVCPNHWMKRTDVRLEEPADADRRTCVILMAPYQGAMYYYRVPLMQYMPADADTYDTTTDDGWAKFVENYEKNYCVQRNHIYDITVTIDRAGGATEKTSVLVTNLQYQAIDWRERESDPITFF